jgi:hypothetical protein
MKEYQYIQVDLQDIDEYSEECKNRLEEILQDAKFLVCFPRTMIEVDSSIKVIDNYNKGYCLSFPDLNYYKARDIEGYYIVYGSKIEIKESNKRNIGMSQTVALTLAKQYFKES